MSAPTSTAAPTTASLAQQAHGYFVARQWGQALAVYQVLAKVHRHALVDHAQALCLVGLGRMEDALNMLDAALLKDPAHWASSLMKARLLTHQGRVDDAQRILQQHADHPDAGPEARLDLGLLELSDLGNPLAARQYLEPLLGNPAVAEKAQAAWWVSNLYDRDCTALQLTQHLHRFARQHLVPSEADAKQIAMAKATAPARMFTKRRRIGLLSPLFTASPVYFLTISTFKAMVAHADLVFYDRSEKKGDWATQQFKAIASTWRTCHQHSPLQLAHLMVHDQLDAIIDLGGWMDWGGLKALAFRPAPRQIKWVGGQSTSTGMSCFDGFVCDQWHVPDNLSHLYSEPLIRVPGGYADYTPPAYMPQALPLSKRAGGYGVISNPNKFSRVFFAHLAMQVMPKVMQGKVPLIFIERRFEREPLRNRVLQSLVEHGFAQAHAAHAAGMIKFLAPRNHPEFLHSLSHLTALLDTFPYSSGLTAAEADALEVPIAVRTGELFCERHSHALQQKKLHWGKQPVVRGPSIAQYLMDYL
ncbi:MAG TPA: tetratricopeptide repeat protein [Limnobacter sp.]|nr:tetratricopeptide repeat protein [Limnobacter sp.]